MSLDYARRCAEDAINAARTDGYEAGFNQAKENYGNAGNGIAHCHRATDEEIEMHGIELWGWCECGRPIIGRWAGLANFCPWCGKIIEWEKEDKK